MKPAPSSLHTHRLHHSQGLRVALIAHRGRGRIGRARASVRGGEKGARRDAEAAAGSEVGGAAGSIHTSFASKEKLLIWSLYMRL